MTKEYQPHMLRSRSPRVFIRLTLARGLSNRAGGHAEMSFRGQNAVITGGAQGLGLGIAQKLWTLDANVYLLDRRKEALEQAIAAWKQTSSPGRLHGLTVDVTDAKSVQQTFERIGRDTGGQVDVLVQAAGITGKTNIQSHLVEVQDFDAVFNVNTRGIFLCARAALPFMLARNYGRIVNIASIAGKEGNAGMLAYSSSKAAVIGLTKVMGKEYAQTGITCNAVAPAVIRTAMVDALPEQQVKYMTDKIPMQRCGTIDEIADLVAFIASKQASFTTGFTWDATGGRATF